jgi:hypothetical protein
MLRSFITHYYEAEKGPFKNVCDLSEEELDILISQEKEAANGALREPRLKDCNLAREMVD